MALATQRVTTISSFKKELASVDVSSPLTVTQNGEPMYIVISPEQYQLQQEQLALLKLLSFSEKDIAAGRVTTHNDLMDEIDQWMQKNAD